MSISTGVMKYNESNDGISYKITCDCGDDNCITTLTVYTDDFITYIEFDKTFSFFYRSLYPTGWYKKIKDLIETFKWRIKSCFEILFIGHIKIRSEIILSNIEHIDNVIEALTKCREFYVNGVENGKNI